MEKLERILATGMFIGLIIAFTGADLDKRAIIYETDRIVSNIMFYGGAIGTGIFTFLASYVHDRNNREENQNINYERIN